MKFFNIIYLYSLNSEVFNKNVKIFWSQVIKYKNLKYQNDYVPIHSVLNHKLNEKTTKNKRGKSKIPKIISINMIVKK